MAGWGYPEFNYTLNENGRRVFYGGPNDPGHDNYLTDVLSSLATSFIRDTVQNDPQQPFFLEVATFAPHQPYTPAPKYAHLYPALQYPRKPSFDAPSTNPPAWLRGRRRADHPSAGRDHAGLPPQSGGCEVRGRHGRGHRGYAALWSAHGTTPTSCSVRTTATTWVSTA